MDSKKGMSGTFAVRLLFQVFQAFRVLTASPYWMCWHGICCGVRALTNEIKGFCYCRTWIRPLTPLFLLWLLAHR